MLIWSSLMLPDNFLEMSEMVIFRMKGWSTARLTKTSFPQKGFDSQWREPKQVTTGIFQSFSHYRHKAGTEKRSSSPLLFTFKAYKAPYI